MKPIKRLTVDGVPLRFQLATCSAEMIVVAQEKAAKLELPEQQVSIWSAFGQHLVSCLAAKPGLRNDRTLQHGSMLI
jgi:hypothetical protein